MVYVVKIAQQTKDEQQYIAKNTREKINMSEDKCCK